MAKKLLLIVTLSFMLICMFASCDLINSHTHSFGEWETVKTATCTESGINERYCECGEKQTQTIYALGHQYGEWVITNEPKCIETGSKERYCECGDKQTQSISALGHQYDEWITTKEATCVQTGEKYAICSTCDKKNTETIPLSETHHYDEGIITQEPTCTTSGSKIITCTLCNNTENNSIPSLGHDLLDNKCSRCGKMVLAMTDDDIYYSELVRSMKRSCYKTNTGYRLFVRFLTIVDGNSYLVQAPAYVDVTIVDEYGNTLYSGTLIKGTYQEEVYIYFDEIADTTAKKVTVFYTVYNDYFYFNKIGEEFDL